MRLLISILVLSLLLPTLLFAGMYHIGKDEGGIYMDTDEDGSWYIDPNHLRHFTLGETGNYTIRTDRRGTYILTAKGRRYYINRSAQEKWKQEVASFNEQQRLKPGVETKVNLLDGTHVLVPVTIGKGKNEMEVTMLLDTGASITVIHREIADQLNLKTISKAKLMIAGGQVLDSEIVKLDFLDVGPIKKQGIEASVIEHVGPQTPYQGLLGMNFLKGVDYRIDYEREVIQWKP